MAFPQTLLDKIGAWFSHLFSGAEKTWKKYEPALQNSMIHASSVIELINNNVDSVPQAILEKIQLKFPDIDFDKLKLGLHAIATEFNLLTGVIDPEPVVTLQAIQAYLKSKDGKAWAWASDAFANLIAIFLAPADTKVTAIVSLMWWCYQKFVKGKVAA